MAKQSTNGHTAASNRSGKKSSPSAGNGENQPTLTVKTNEKGQILK